MILYVNGDSHSAGAEAVNSFCFAQDDPALAHLRDIPHPDNIPHSFGYKLANILNAGFTTDAISSASNDRILRTSKQFLENHPSTNIFLLIGWSSPEREEWYYNERYYQVNGSGMDTVPDELVEQYKNFVAGCDKQHYGKKITMWEDKIYNFHLELKEKSIKHLFFNTMTQLYTHKNWGDNYILDPYCDWLKTNGYKTKHAGSYHYGPDGHTAWAKHLLPHIRKILES